VLQSTKAAAARAPAAAETKSNVKLGSSASSPPASTGAPTEASPSKPAAAAASDEEEAFAQASLPNAQQDLASMQIAGPIPLYPSTAPPAAAAAPAVPPTQPSAQQKQQPSAPAAASGEESAGPPAPSAAITGPTVLPASFELVTGPLPFRFPRPAAKGEAHGFVFMCTNATRKECVERGIFGSPENPRSIAQMSKISPVFTQVFLYNVDERTFEGVWETSEEAGKHLEPYAWTRKWDGTGISTAQGDKDGLRRTKFCMQARVTRKFTAMAYRSQVEGFLTRIGGSLFDQVLKEEQVLRLIAALFWNARNPGVQQAAKNTELQTKQQLGPRGGAGRGRGRGRGGTAGRGRGRGGAAGRGRTRDTAPVGGFKEDYQFS